MTTKDVATVEFLPPALPGEKRERISVDQGIRLWLSTFPSLNTRRAYKREILSFAAFMGAGAEGGADAMARFLAMDDHQAHSLVDAYNAALKGRGLSPATVNRSMAALNSFADAARRYGLTALRLEARSERHRAYRDTRGPGTDGVQRLIAQARKQPPWKAARDEAIIRLGFALGLRRAEIVELNLAHLDTEAATVSIKGKGELERRTLAVPPTALASVVAWLEHRGAAAGPLFYGVDSHGRMSGSGLYHLIVQLGRAAGINARPHGLRHAAITAVLDATNGDVRKAQAFGRHANPATTMRYDDNRQDLGGAAARILDGLVD